MFTYIKLKNYLSFGDVVFNFKQSANEIKNFVAIYGENGSGKSNFVDSIDFLHHTLTSFDRIKSIEELSQIVNNSANGTPNSILDQIMLESNTEQYFLSHKMIDNPYNAEVEFGFLLDDYEGFYRIVFSDRILNESLYYFTGKQRGYLFDISSDGNIIKSKFWSKLFTEENAKEETIVQMNKYWGKHSFLGIIVHQINEQNESYTRKSISEYLLKIIDMFFDTSVFKKKSRNFNINISNRKPIDVLNNLESGKIEIRQLKVLEKSEKILNDFFSQTYADIKEVFYETKALDDGSIYYELFVKKMISGKIRQISFKNESAGTQQVLSIARILLGLFCGTTVVYDEIDNGIHDVLLCNIISSLKSEMSGQLIITTHNTLLLEEIEPKNAYVICVDYLGNKQAKCLSDFSIQNNNNARIKYLKGMFGGIPNIEGIDYDSIISIINNDEEDG